MISNSAVTIYCKMPDDTYKRIFISECFWQNIKAKEIKKYGAENASSVSVMIFKNSLDGYISPENFVGDGFTVDAPNDTYIVKGECLHEISESITELLENYREVYRVCESTENLYGSNDLQHIRIEGK